METLKISSNNFWIKLYCFIYNINSSDTSSFPRDTCSLRKNLLFGIPLLVIALPIVLINFIAHIVSKKEYSFFGRESNAVFFCVGTLLSIVSIGLFNDFFVVAGGIPWFVAQAYFFQFLLVFILASVFTIAILIAMLWGKLSEVDFKRKGQKKDKKPGVLVELYRSAKEKYCKKIEYID